MSKKNVFPVLIASILLIIALYQASAQRQPTTTKQSIDLLANAGWEEVGIGSASGGGISNNAGKSAWPSMAIDQFDNAFVSWNDDSSGVDQIYILRWNGFLWEEMGLNSASAGGISNTGEKSLAPAIAIQPYDSFVCIAWRDWVSGYAETYWKCWNGNDWWPDNIYDISNQEGQSLSFSSMVYTNSPSHPQPYITWNESDGNDQEIYVATINFQTGWYIIQPSGLSNNINDSWSPSIGMVGNFGPTYVAWHDHSHDENAAEIYIRNVNGDEVGSNSASVGGISNTPGQSSSASLTVSDDGQLFVAWEDNTNGNYEIYVRHWNGYQWSELGTGSASGGGISNNPGDSLRPRVALDPNGTPYIAWYDNSSGNYE
ncbi:MAG: hypothetical protein KDE48_14845, partial [Anaerolineales bacterium]|nr:hypothetical protein [Anaerolineales bacterium]